MTVYEVGRPPSSPAIDVGGGPATLGGVVTAKGTNADMPSLSTDPAGSHQEHGGRSERDPDGAADRG